MFLEIGVGAKKVIYSIDTIFEHVGEKMAMSLPAIHCFTGNDYTSAFHGIGKKLLKNDFLETFEKIRDRFVLDAELFPKIELFT